MLSTCIIFTLNIDRDYLCAESLDKKKQKFDLSEWKTEIAKVSNDIMQCIQREPVLSLSSIFLSLSHIFLSLSFSSSCNLSLLLYIYPSPSHLWTLVSLIPDFTSFMNNYYFKYFHFILYKSWMSAQVQVPVFLQCHDHTLMFFLSPRYS